VIEITCPGCQARYQVPETALGETGRQVTCSSCGHTWLARPPEPVGAAEPGEARQGARADRTRQLAEIRQMLDEVQHAEERREQEAPRAVPPAPDAEPEPPRGGRGRRGRGRRDDVPDIDDTDEELEATAAFLRDRIGLSGQEGRLRSARANEDGSRTAADTRQLMDRHRRKTRQRKLQEKRGQGAGTTGFLFVIAIAAVLTGLYVFDDEIVARMPESERAMRDYVAAVDSVRVDVAEGVAKLRTLLEEQFAEEG
jgi:predicted Zn finger-like uncharacterized protein